MIRGVYAEGIPVVRATVRLLGNQSSRLVGRGHLSFQVDTGAFKTLVAASSLINFGIVPQQFDAYARQTRPVVFQGVDGRDINGYPIETDVYFLDYGLGRNPRRYLGHRIEILIVREQIEGLYPNLLGRDLLEQMSMHYCPDANKLELRSLRPHSTLWLRDIGQAASD